MTTKEKVLEILTQNYGTSVSGEKLADHCGVSRAAVWKAVKTLREQGCNIQGTTNGGYLLSASDLFSTESFLNHLSEVYPQFSKSHVETFSVIDSTNTYAKRILAECGNLRNPNGELTEAGLKFHNSIYVAESQTAGRGRLGRTFVSPSKTGIYLTVIYAPKGGIKNPAKLTAFTGVAVCRVIKKLFDVTPSIKWINDIFVNGKKIAGILTEGSTNFETGAIESAVIGIGINIADNPDVFPKDVAKIAGSIVGKSQDKKISRADLASEIAGETLSIFDEEPSTVVAEYRQLNFLIGKTISVHPLIGAPQVYEATAIDIDNDASLVVQLEDGTVKSLSSGEVSLHSDSI